MRVKRLVVGAAAVAATAALVLPGIASAQVQAQVQQQVQAQVQQQVQMQIVPTNQTTSGDNVLPAVLGGAGAMVLIGTGGVIMLRRRNAHQT